MMLYPSMTDLLKKVPNRYSLVNVAAKRARDLADEVEKDPDAHLDEKPVSIALDDIINGRIIPIERPLESEIMTLEANETMEGAFVSDSVPAAGAEDAAEEIL